MKQHPIQGQLLDFVERRDGDLEGLSLRQIGESIGIGKKPQVVSHHLHQLELKGLLRRESPDSKKFSVSKKPVSDVVYVNLFESAECGPEGVLGDDAVVDKIPLSSRTFGITNPDDFFLIKARGESMEPMIKSGDLVLAKRQNDVENGSVAVVIHDEMPKIKKIIKNSSADGESYSLVSLNQDYSKEDVYDTDGELRIAGLVRAIIRLPVQN